MRLIKQIAVLTILVPVMSWTVGAQVPQQAPGKVYPDPKTTPGEIIEPPGLKPKPVDPKPVPEAQIKKEPDRTLVKLGIGEIVIGSDDRNVGRIINVAAEPDGWVKEIHVKIDSLDGTTGKIVVVKAGSFGRSKDGIRLSIPSSEVPKLPVIAEQPG